MPHEIPHTEKELFARIMYLRERWDDSTFGRVVLLGTEEELKSIGKTNYRQLFPDSDKTWYNWERDYATFSAVDPVVKVESLLTELNNNSGESPRAKREE